jgi:hypothetical protein
MENNDGLFFVAAGLIHEVRSAAQIVQETVAQLHANTARLGAMAAGANFG